MKKSTVILIAIVCSLSFFLLVYYGLRYSRGVPTVIEEKKKTTLVAVPFIDKDINLAHGLALELWIELKSQEIELMHQVTVLPWGKGLVSPVRLKAFHNGRHIYFYLSWPDDTEDRVVDKGKFSDACAIMFPLGDKVQTHTIMMGFMGKANIWQWKASQNKEYWLKEEETSGAYVDFYYPFEEEELLVVSKDRPVSAVNDLVAIRVGTITPKEKQDVEGRGLWEKGRWQVVFRRLLKEIDPETGAVFEGLKERLCALAVWNGSQGDRGGRKSISDWVELRIKWD